MPDSNEFFSFIPIIAGQFLSYYLAVGLDKRKDYFINSHQIYMIKKCMKLALENFFIALKKVYLINLDNLVKLSSKYLNTNMSNNEIDSTKKLLYNN